MATDSVTAKRLTWASLRRLPGWLSLALLAAGVVLLGLGLARTGSPVVVEVDGQRYHVRTHATTVGEALRRAGFDLYLEDRVSPALDVPLQSASPLTAPGGVIIQVQRARPVELRVDGGIRQLRTHVTTVGQLLAEAGVVPHPADEVWLDGRLVEADAPLWGSETGLATDAGARTVSSRGGQRPSAVAVSSAMPVVTLRRAVPVLLDDDGMTTALRTTLETVGQVLQGQGILLYLGDEVTPGLHNRITAGMTVAIHRSVPVQIQVDGRTIHTRTRAESVAGVLGQEGIALLGKDRVEPALSAPIHAAMTIDVTRVREEAIVEFEPIPFQTEWVPDPEIEVDTIRLLQAGQVGLTKRRYRAVYEDDREVGRTLEDVWTEQPPITKTMAYGTKIIIRTLETPDGPIEYWRKMRVYTTSYTAAQGGKPRSHPRYGYTRLGLWLTKGIVAVDPTVIPLKTRMYVPGYGFAYAGDTGGGVKGKFVDLGFDEGKYQSWHWWTDIYLLTPVPSADKIRWILPDWPKFPDRRR